MRPRHRPVQEQERDPHQLRDPQQAEQAQGAAVQETAGAPLEQQAERPALRQPAEAA